MSAEVILEWYFEILELTIQEDEVHFGRRHLLSR